MEVYFRAVAWIRVFLGGLFLGVFLMWSSLYLDKLGYIDLAIDYLLAATTNISLNADGNISGSRVSCAVATNYECLTDATGTSTAPTDPGHILHIDGSSDSYALSDLTGASVISTVYMPVYHRETNANEAVYVSLWNSAETVQYGSTVQLTTRTTAGWDTATFASLGLTQTQFNDLRVRTLCLRPGGGAKGNCEIYALYPVVNYTQQIDLTVSASGSQQNLEIGTTSAPVGGTFVITENTSSRTISSITINETGTVDAAADLGSIELWYDLDTSAPYDCASETYADGATQYGSTDIDGFSAANGSATFTDSVSVSTTQTLCVYPVVDVLSSATINQTIELQITNPTTDIVGSGSPVIEPNTAVVLPGTTTLLDEDVHVTDFHWRNDDGTETTASSATGDVQNTSIGGGSKGANYRLRYAVANTGTQLSSAKQYRVEYGTKVTTCSAVSVWTDVGAVGGDWDMASDSGLTEAANTTDIASGGVISPNPASTFLATNGGQRESTSQTGALSLPINNFVELEYAIVSSSGIADGTSYCFRISDAGSTATVTNDIYPEFTVAADLTVSTAGSQVTSVVFPSTNVYAGGMFVIEDTTAGGAHNLLSITITASSTAAITTDITNVKLYYDLDTSGADGYNCSSESYSGTESQFGGTVSNFTSTSSATFSDTVSVNDTQSVCLYVVYDVSAGVINGEQIDFGIANPSNDITTNGGSVAPADSVDLAGVTTFVSPVVVQGNYHWRNDDGAEGAASSATGGVENTPYDKVVSNSTVRLRFDISNTGGSASGAYQYRLEWAQKVSSCSAVSVWTSVDAAGDAFAIVASQLVDGANTTNISTGIGGVTNQATGSLVSPNGGQEETSATTNAITLPANQFVELEYSLSPVDATAGATYCFRVTNNGTALNSYLQYPELTMKQPTDFAVTRNVAVIPNGATSVTITKGTNYTLQRNDASRAFIRITSAGNTGAGPGGITSSNASDITAYVSNPNNINTSITFTRAGTNGNTRIAWEIVEYVGAVGGENEFVIRGQGVATYGTANTTVTTATIGSIGTDADVVPWITGQGNPDAGRRDYNTGLSTSAWNAANDTATFTRGEAGSDAVNVSYAIIEFTGANWKIQRDEHTYSSAGSPESSTAFNAVNSTNKTFLHVQKRVGTGLDTHADFGHEVYMPGVGSITYLLDGTAGTPGSHTSVAWIIENTQNQGSVMRVSRSNGTVPSSGTGPVTVTPSIGRTLDDLTIASIMVNGRASSANRTFPEPIFTARLLTASLTTYELWIGDPSDSISYRTEVVEWPTAAAQITQNYYQLFADNGTYTPTDPWPVGVTDLAENAEMTAGDEPIATGESVRIRMSLQIGAAQLAAGVDSFRLEYAARPEASTCSAVADASWHRVGDIGSTTALWRGTSTPLTDGTTLPSTILSVSDVTGTYEEENPSALVPEVVLVGEDIEYDWHIEDNQATDKTDYCFRMTYANGDTLFAYAFYPVVRTVGYEAQSWDWRWYDDETSPTPSLPLAGENIAPIDIANQNILKLRMLVSEISGAAGVDAKFKLQYSEEADFSQVFDVVSTTTCTANSLWCYADGAGVDNATIDAAVLAHADSCTAGSGPGCGTYNESAASSTATLDHQAQADTEFEFTVQQAGARVGAVYYFRLYDVQNDVAVTASSSYPSVLTEGGSLTFTVSGVSALTATEGVTTDVTTTPTSIDFGDLPLDEPVEAAQQITIQTNATEGYRVLVYATQNLLNTYGDAIAAVSGTNNLPDDWISSCAGTGCFGYHAGDDSLFGGSTRFAAVDTYAGFSIGVPEEIMYSGQPAVSESTDIIYKVQVSQLQPAGRYENSIVFLAVPIF